MICSFLVQQHVQALIVMKGRIQESGCQVTAAIAIGIAIPATRRSLSMLIDQLSSRVVAVECIACAPSFFATGAIFASLNVRTHLL